MSNLAVFFIFVQVCLIQHTVSQCLRNIANPPTFNLGFVNPGRCSQGAGISSYGFGSSLASSELGLSATELSFDGCPTGTYGGIGVGDVRVIGEVPVAGSTVIAGQVPILGLVRFDGALPAAGSVSISGMCSCGCDGYGL